MRSIWFPSAAFLVCLVPTFCGKRHSLEWQRAIGQERMTSWVEFKQKYNKTYESDYEEEKRFGVWMTTLKFIKQHNAEADKGRKSFWLAPNHFADMTEDEFSTAMLGLHIRLPEDADLEQASSVSSDDLSFLPREVDWRRKGYVTPVKNQKHCGSCYAFSAMGSLEGQHFRSNGTLVSLSEQNILDCSSNNKYYNHGCHGGTMDHAFRYVIDKGGVDTEESYPYEAEVGTCRYNKAGRGATARSYHDIRPRGSEEELQRALAEVGPISIGIDAHGMWFRSYSYGIYQSYFCSSHRLNHGVLVVGYGSENGEDFWIVKNSWSTEWGDEGYLKMARNKDNMCGIATMASYPIV